MKINFNFEEKNVKLGLENQFTIQEFLETTAVKILMLKGEKGDTVSAEWGTITGDIADQTDLASVLDTKADTTDIPDVSHFITKDVDNLTNYTKTSDLSAVATSGDYDDLDNKPTIPSKTSDLTNDSGYIDNTVDNLTNYTKTSNLSAVATSGSYNDLSNKPTIPSKTSDLTNDSNFAVTNADNKFSVGQTIAGETVVDSIRTKNMFDKNSVTNGYFYTSTGGTSTDTGTFIQNTYIEVKPNTSYTFSASSGDYFRFCEYDSNKTFIQRQIASDVSSNTKTYTTSSTTNYVRVSCNITNLSSLQLEEGSTATTYSPYQNLDGMDKEVIRTTATPNSSYISTVQVNQVTKCGKIVTVDFRGLVSANIPNNTTIITLPYHFVAEGTAPAYLGGAYDYASTLWCSWGNNGNVFRAGSGFGSATGKYVHIHLVYITSD